MGRWIVLLLLTATLSAANVKLYLKDGTFQLAREYEVNGDRVRYFSVERGEWEEIPLALCDLKKTKAEVTERSQEIAADAKADAEEEAAERTVRKEIGSVPMEAGAYYVVEGKPLQPLKQAELKVVNNNRRKVLQVLSPIPIVTGRSHVEIDGTQSSFKVHEDRPEFYLRLANPERFGIVKLWPGKNARIVERWEIIPVSKELMVEHQDVEIFRRQAAEELYKIWPVKPLGAGEYAVIEFTEGKGNTTAWDFAVTM